MKNQSTVMQKMLWKDAKTIWPLVQAILIGIVAFNLMALLASSVMHKSNTYKLYMAFWMLMPNLVALGAPALLVGSEEESGTLAWLRTLPVKWQRVVDSKFLVSIVAVLVTWLVSTVIAYALCYSSTGVIRSGSGAPLYAAELLSLKSVGHLLFMSLTLLATGFATAYLIRSPIAALITLVPIVALFYQVTYIFGTAILSGNWYEYPSYVVINASYSRWALTIAAGIGWLVFLWFVQRQLGGRRLTSAGRRRKPVKTMPKMAYRPPSGVGLQPPSEIGALLWQQGRQVGLAVSVMGGVSILFLLLLLTIPRGDVSGVVAEFSPLIVGVSAMWIGSLAFYGDSVRRRCAYFADRGISPTQVWWTRLLIPGIACLVMTILAFINNMITGQSGRTVSFPWYVIPVLFGFGQLVSLWVSRPILSFFAAPVYAIICCFYYFVFFDWYPDYAWTTCLLLPVLLFATWRLTRRWMDGQIDNGFHLRAVGYTVLAVVIPLCIVIGYRIATTPSEDSQWRKKAMAAASRINWQNQANGGFSTLYNSWNHGYVGLFSSPDEYAMLQSDLQKELDGSDIQHQVSTHKLRMTINANYVTGVDGTTISKTRHDCIEVMLKWTTELRQQATDGRVGLGVMEGTVEPMERAAVEFLLSSGKWIGDRSDIHRLVEMIPNKELRHQSRKVSLLREWRRFQEPKNGIFTSGFLERPFESGLLLTSIENRRSRRFIDKLVNEAWEDLENGLPEKLVVVNANGQRSSCIENRRANDYWWQASSVQGNHFPNLRFALFSNWTTDYEQEIEKLRNRYPAVDSNAEKLEASTE